MDEWKFGRLAEKSDIRVCEDCGDVSLEDEMHRCPGKEDSSFPSDSQPEPSVVDKLEDQEDDS